jgi:hypothetical protein
MGKMVMYSIKELERLMRSGLSEALSEHCNRPRLFSNDLPGILVSPQADKLDMSHMVRIRPFEEFEICHELGLHPNALLYLRGSQSLTPPASLQFRQVCERTFPNE